MNPIPLEETNFQLPGQKDFYRGKVRDVYTLQDDKLVMVASDRISAFDCILPRAMPYKGEVLNTIATAFLERTSHIVPNWLDSSPHPAVSIGKKCEPILVEMVVRNYLCGHALREYQAGKESICGVAFPKGLKAYQQFPNPIITPTTKATEGHDEDISREEIIRKGIVSQPLYEKLEEYSLSLFDYGTRYAKDMGLILADTKYEFGIYKGEIILMDEIHTPDSSRYFYLENYDEQVEQGEEPRQLSKEFVRQWLISEGFQGKEGQKMPDMNRERIQLIMNRYFELYEKLIGQKFRGSKRKDPQQEVYDAILGAI